MAQKTEPSPETGLKVSIEIQPKKVDAEKLKALKDVLNSSSFRITLADEVLWELPRDKGNKR